MYAIIYTGEVRTIEKTIDYLKNVLSENMHVFAVLQSKDTKYYTDFVTEKLGTNLKSIEWFENTQEWIQIRDSLLQDMTMPGIWKDYLKNSGSMIEYYQMYLASKKIEQKENLEHFKYDYVMRIRCDVILTHPIDFDINRLSKQETNDFLQEIKLYHTDTLSAMKIFMKSFFHRQRMYAKTYDQNQISDSFSPNTDLHDYLLNGDYVISLRVNVIYFMKRKTFEKISHLGITYGKYKMKNQEYWFNAESQFQTICTENNIDVFDSTMDIEDKSLYNYTESDYFENGNLKTDCLFFIRRY